MTVVTAYLPCRQTAAPGCTDMTIHLHVHSTHPCPVASSLGLPLVLDYICPRDPAWETSCFTASTLHQVSHTTWQAFAVSKEPIKSIVDVCGTKTANSKLCHVCNECVALTERVNVQRHCETKHQEAYPQISEVRAHKITEMGVQYDDQPNFVESQIDR